MPSYHGRQIRSAGLRTVDCCTSTRTAPMRYLHVVFTLPRYLAPVVLQNKGDLRSLVSCQRGNSPRSRSRSQTPRCRFECIARSLMLEPEKLRKHKIALKVLPLFLFVLHGRITSSLLQTRNSRKHSRCLQKFPSFRTPVSSGSLGVWSHAPRTP